MVGGHKLNISCHLYDVLIQGFLYLQSGGLIYFFLQEWQFVNEFQHVLGKCYLCMAMM